MNNKKSENKSIHQIGRIDYQSIFENSKFALTL